MGESIIIGLLIALVTAILNHVLANTRDAKNRRLDQGRKVIDAFQPELDTLVQTSNDAILIMTDEVFDRHDSAIRNFLRYLSWIDRFRLLHKWRALSYHQKDKNHHIPFYVQYSDFGSLDKRKRVRPIVIKRIQEIISFASK